MLEWADVTAQKKAEKEVEQLISAAASGQLSQRIDAKEFEGFFQRLSTGVNRLMDAVEAPLAEAQTVLTALASGDLTKQVTGSY